MRPELWACDRFGSSFTDLIVRASHLLVRVSKREKNKKSRVLGAEGALDTDHQVFRPTRSNPIAHRPGGRFCFLKITNPTRVDTRSCRAICRIPYGVCSFQYLQTPQVTQPCSLPGVPKAYHTCEALWCCDGDVWCLEEERHHGLGVGNMRLYKSRIFLHYYEHYFPLVCDLPRDLRESSNVLLGARGFQIRLCDRCTSSPLNFSLLFPRPCLRIGCESIIFF